MAARATGANLEIAKAPTDMSSPAMASPAASTMKGAGAPSLIEQLKLTADQKQKIATLRRNRTIEINKVLTPDQKAKFEAARKSGKATSESMAALGLKPDQKKKIVDIAKKSAEGIMGVLNPQQKKQVVTYLKQRQGGLE
jgi:Spy/CpxP family protein refolding chaperone